MNMSTDDRPELVFGLVGPAGVRLDDLARVLKEYLKTAFGYHAIDIRLSDLLRNYSGWTAEVDSSEYTRITHRQEKGLQFRQSLKDGAALARAGITEIRSKRADFSKNPDRGASAHAYILDQLKHPAEVELLRQVYGPSFILLAGHAPRPVRLKVLADRLAHKDDKPGDPTYKEKAEHIVHIDDKQDDDKDLGQNTRDTYPLADFFANLARDGGENDVKRFVDLLFGHPFHTPLPAEYAMYQASAGSLRSSDESRQVGAVIVTLRTNVSGKIANVDIVASGMNEVPRRGGGFYWHEDSPDGRDQWLVEYSNDDRARKIKIGVLSELMERVKGKGWLAERIGTLQPNQLARELLPDLRRTQFMDIGEFVRPVHAEMAALIDSARRGVPVNGLSMYVTAFPCHNCAKHIIAAGLRRVVYLEPYPKSRAELLHGEEINLESVDGTEQDERVLFSAFTGVAPRQYQQLFSMTARGAKRGLSLKQWNAGGATLRPRYIPRNASAAYVQSERQELEKLTGDVYSWDKNAVCPDRQSI
jgi:cytidine deaminase